MDWDDLRTFLAVARTGSLTEAARGLGVSYSTVRTHLRSISAKLGARSMVNAVVTARELELLN